MMPRMRLNDVHCHFFSARFFELLFDLVLRQAPHAADPPAERLTRAIGWEAPGGNAELADRWRNELDRHQVSRAALIASVPGDESSVAEAVDRHPHRFVGFFMFDPTADAAPERLERAIKGAGLRGVCLFPAMHRYPLFDDRVVPVFEAASRFGAAVFVHCGALSVGIRTKLRLPSHFDVRFGNPLDLQHVASRFADVPVIIPHFGAGMLREALMLADLCANVHLDTSSSNSWIKYYPGLTLARVFAQALSVAGPRRLVFGTDSSFFPRGWQRDIHDQQVRILDEIGVSGEDRALVMGGNFDRLFPGAQP
jgi:predicted TIM-barrel fold metal-dependent hydrolase